MPRLPTVESSNRRAGAHYVLFAGVGDSCDARFLTTARRGRSVAGTSGGGVPPGLSEICRAGPSQQTPHRERRRDSTRAVSLLQSLRSTCPSGHLRGTPSQPSKHGTEMGRTLPDSGLLRRMTYSEHSRGEGARRNRGSRPRRTAKGGGATTTGRKGRQTGDGNRLHARQLIPEPNMVCFSKTMCRWDQGEG